MPNEPAREPVGSHDPVPDEGLRRNDAWAKRLGPIGGIRLRDWSAIVRKAKHAAPPDPADQDRRAA